MHIAGASYANKPSTAPPAPAPSSGTATSASSSLEGKESGDVTMASGASTTVDAVGAITNTNTHTAKVPSPATILKDTAPQQSSSTKIESSNAGVKCASLLTGFNGADINDFVQRRSAEAASNDEEERIMKAQVQVQVQVRPQLVDAAVAVDADRSINASASAGPESVSTSAHACPTCGVDKKTVVPVIDRSAAIMTASSSDSSVTAASSSQSHGVTATTTPVGSDQDSTTDGKGDQTISSSGSQVTENLSAVSTSMTEGTMGQNPPDMTDTILSASLYIIGTLICAIVVRRLILLFLLARSHIPDSDRGDL